MPEDEVVLFLAWLVEKQRSHILLEEFENKFLLSHAHFAFLSKLYSRET